MNFAYNHLALESFLPVLAGTTLGLLAILGTRELFKETSTALKRGAKA
tara:strand:+ start:863 stop:1006 length:144 start_codon:yes stop_codon:yes gene_type:complete